MFHFFAGPKKLSKKGPAPVLAAQHSISISKVLYYPCRTEVGRKQASPALEIECWAAKSPPQASLAPAMAGQGAKRRKRSSFQTTIRNPSFLFVTLAVFEPGSRFCLLYVTLVNTIEPRSTFLLVQKSGAKKDLPRSWHPALNFSFKSATNICVGRWQGGSRTLQRWKLSAGTPGRRGGIASCPCLGLQGEMTRTSGELRSIGSFAAGDPAKGPPPTRLACDKGRRESLR
jgi:hypothetical protein